MSHPTCWLSDGALGKMVSEAGKAAPKESGGMLLGWENPDRHEIVVAAVVGPGPMAEHTASAFRPDGEWQQHELEAHYERSGGRITYLGDWHVHPQGGLAMSRRDRRTLSSIASHDEARCLRPLMGVLAPDGEKYGVGVWLWEPSWLVFNYGKVTALDVRRWKPTEDEQKTWMK